MLSIMIIGFNKSQIIPFSTSFYLSLNSFSSKIRTSAAPPQKNQFPPNFFSPSTPYFSIFYLFYFYWWFFLFLFFYESFFLIDEKSISLKVQSDEKIVFYYLSNLSLYNNFIRLLFKYFINLFWSWFFFILILTY